MLFANNYDINPLFFHITYNAIPVKNAGGYLLPSSPIQFFAHIHDPKIYFCLPHTNFWDPYATIIPIDGFFGQIQIKRWLLNIFLSYMSSLSARCLKVLSHATTKSVLTFLYITFFEHFKYS